VCVFVCVSMCYCFYATRV